MITCTSIVLCLNGVLLPTSHSKLTCYMIAVKQRPTGVEVDKGKHHAHAASTHGIDQFCRDKGLNHALAL